MYPKKSPNVTKEDFLKKLEENGCRVYAAVRELNISYKTYHNWRHSDEEFAKQVEILRQGKHKIIEDKLMELINDDSNPGIQLRSIMFYLTCQAGWKETKNINVNNANTVDVNLALKEIQDKLTGLQE